MNEVLVLLRHVCAGWVDRRQLNPEQGHLRELGDAGLLQVRGGAIERFSHAIGLAGG